ncbi:SMI1/KNR4 family protein [Microvirga arabica]|uniref:SMI1/KNR4 family protein n=1 Tax=Microvirga arabica TaxID=1128671 RepID=A0ABV6YCL5_9HYPH
MKTIRRLIVPVTERWNEGEQDWSFVKDPSHDIRIWEKTNGMRLPDGYRRFMLAFNGGCVYPRLFFYAVPLEYYPSTEPVTFVDLFYSWSDVRKYSRGDVYGRGNPPDMLFIGSTPGGLQILMSLRAEEFGQIFCWVHNTNIWGTDGNDHIWYQASSFENFLKSLYDEPDRSDYDNWRIPIYDKLAKPLAF